ncbi:YjgN family protein [Planktomarina temperata]|nr:YjgN family protein [Planktomarina temperata]
MTDTSTLQGEGATSAPTHLYGVFLSENSKLFWLVTWTGALTIVTLGIYRFWARTRLRRYIWSSIRPGGDSFEYTGTGLEKFLGFLIALVVLAVYLGLLQVVLSFIGFSLWGAITSEPRGPMDVVTQLGATYVTGLAVLPLIFFAQYRARRYMLSRTRWRGLRFAMDAAAVGYAWRALLYFGLSIVTLGALMPLATFRLEKYMTDRMWYGDASFEQEGQWTALYGAMKHLFIAVGLLLPAGVIIYWGLFLGFLSILSFAGCIWLLFGFIYYQVESFKYLTAQKVLDGQVRFTSQASCERVIGIFVQGIILITILTIVLILIFVALYFVFSALGSNGMPGGGAGAEIFGGSGLLWALLVVILGSLACFVLIGALATVFISAPILGHIVDTLRVENSGQLEQIRQRAGDLMDDADGFADALDVGGAF